MITLRPHEDLVEIFQRCLKVGEKKIPSPDQTGRHDGEYHELDIRSIDCTQMDLSAYDADSICFDDDTRFPAADKLPEDFHADTIMDLHKNPGLGVRSLHARGITGKGLAMAIIDQPLSSHREYEDNLVHYEELGYENPPSGVMHGAAVSSIAVGKTTGVTPDAKLYYFAANNFHNWDKQGEWVSTAVHYAKALDRILEINEKLPAKDKIQVVSVSWGGQGHPQTIGREQWAAALERAKKAGLFVDTCALIREYGLASEGLGRRLYGDPDDKQSYTVKCFDVECSQEFQREKLAFPEDHRTTASPTRHDKYVHYRNGGASWVTPFEAALFVLARQVDPAVTPEKFFEKGLQTGTFSPECKSVIADPVALIDALQREHVRAQAMRKAKGAGR